MWHLQVSTISLSDFKVGTLSHMPPHSLKTREAAGIHQEGGKRKKCIFKCRDHKKEDDRTRKEVGQVLQEGKPQMSAVRNDSDQTLSRNGFGHCNAQSRWPLRQQSAGQEQDQQAEAENVCQFPSWRIAGQKTTSRLQQHVWNWLCLT